MKLSIVLLFSLLWVSVSVGMDSSRRSNSFGSLIKKTKKKSKSSLSQKSFSVPHIKRQNSGSDGGLVSPIESSKLGSPRSPRNLRPLLDITLPNKNILSIAMRMKSRHKSMVSYKRQHEDGTYSILQLVGKVMYVLKSKVPFDLKVQTPHKAQQGEHELLIAPQIEETICYYSYNTLSKVLQSSILKSAQSAQLPEGTFVEVFHRERLIGEHPIVGTQKIGALWETTLATKKAVYVVKSNIKNLEVDRDESREEFYITAEPYMLIFNMLKKGFSTSPIQRKPYWNTVEIAFLMAMPLLENKPAGNNSSQAFSNSNQAKSTVSIEDLQFLLELAPKGSEIPKALSDLLGTKDEES